MCLHFSQLGRRQVESDIARLMTAAIERPELLSLAAGFTDNDTLPLEEVTELTAALGARGDRRVLQYGSNQGLPELRKAMTRRMQRQDLDSGARVGSGFDSEMSFIANGSQQALYLAAQTLCDPGDIVLVEQPTYFVFLEMLRGLGVEAVSMAMLRNGDVDVAALEAQLSEFERTGEIERVKAVYLVTYYANPTGRTVGESCKRGMLACLERRGGRIALFEDAAYRELYFDQAAAVPSALGLSAEMGTCVPVFYTTTLTKPFAAGLKVGYGYCSHRDWLRRMLAVKGQQDFGTSRYVQEIALRAVTTDVFEDRLALLRRSYRDKMRTLNESLRSELDGLGWNWVAPQGGLYLWLSAPEGVDTGFDSAFHADCIDAGVMYVPGQLCFADSSESNKARLSFGVLHLDELREAARRFASAANVKVK